MSEFIKIVFDYVSFSYNEKPLIKNLSFSVSKGARLVIEGDSGTGKTTIIRLLLGFEIPEKGAVNLIVNNEKLSSKEFRKFTAWLPQDLNLGSGTVNEIINFPFGFKINASRKPDANIIRENLHRVGLNPNILYQPYQDLSTGQRQRVGIVLCHLLDKPLLMLDEPTSALDKTSIDKVAKLIFSKPERTVISTSHDPSWVAYFERRIRLE